MGADWIQILDEADYHLLDREEYDGCNAGYRIIGFTATPIKQSTVCMEQDHLERRGFKVIDTCVQPVNSLKEAVMQSI